MRKKTSEKNRRLKNANTSSRKINKELLQINAEDFLNAYQILSESNEKLADRIDGSSATLASEMAFGAKPAMGPEIVCLAFSVELYVKHLHYVSSGKAPPRSHKILELFEKLPEQMQQRIFAHDAIRQNPFIKRGNIFLTKRITNSDSVYDGFFDQIRAISEGFEKWRYSHENSVLCYNSSFALALIEAIRSVANEVRLNLVNNHGFLEQVEIQENADGTAQ